MATTTKLVLVLLLGTAMSLALSGSASAAAAAKSYQVTGPILELTDAKIVVDKDGEKWEIARTADTKVLGELKVGAKVTIKYFMTATSIEVKEAKAAEEKTPEAKPAKAAAAPTK